MAKKSTLSTTPELDRDGWDKVKETSTSLVTSFVTLRNNQTDCENAYFMDWQESPSGADLKLTISPDPHNKVTGAVRLLTATAPQFNVPRDVNDPDAQEKSSKIETMANAMWARSNAIQEIVTEKEVAFCGLLYDEMYIQIVSTKDILERVQKAASAVTDPMEKARWDGEVEHAQDVAARTPFLFVPLPVMSSYFIKNITGMSAFYSKVETTVGEVLSMWGDAARTQLIDKPDSYLVTLHMFYDRRNSYVWLEGQEDPLLAGPHGLSFIPVVAYVPNGSKIFSKPERSHLPMLYPVIKSKIWDAQNLFLTVTRTNAASLMNAMFALQKAQLDDKVGIDHSVIGGIVEVPPGATLRPLAKEIVDQTIVQLNNMYGDLMDESTIFNQTLGQPISGNATYSATALLHQAGRLPLTPIQEGMSKIFGKCMEIAFKWLKTKPQGKAKVVDSNGKTIELAAADIPERIEFKVIVDVDLPQDKMQQASVGAALAGGDDPITSKEWVRSEILGIGQSDQEQKTIWREQMANAAAKLVFQQFLQQLMTQQGQPQQGQPQPGQTPGQPGQPTQGQPTPEQMQQMQQQGQAQQGQMPTAPPEQMVQPEQPMTQPPAPGSMLSGGQ